jgi:hypothetical protein
VQGRTAASAGEEAEPHGPDGVVGVGVEQADRLPGPERESPLDDRHGQRRRHQQWQDVVSAVTGRAVAMAVQPVVPWQEALQRVQEVDIGPGPDLDHDDPRGRVRHEDGEQPVGLVGDERGARAGQIREGGRGPGPDREFLGPYGKMLRSASRRRPRPPLPGADS